MIDTHSHLLPGVDHGCPDLETSVSMAREAAGSGIDTVICTPHLADLLPEDIERTRGIAELVKAELVKAGIELKLLLGFEVDVAVAATCSLEELSSLTVESSRGVIVLEMPYEGWPRFLEDTLFRLTTWGLRPVLAHPERNDRIQRSPELLVGCLKAGAVGQATAASLSGEFGRGPGRALHKLLAQGAISLLASDAHAYRTESWTLTQVLADLRGSMTSEELDILVDKNPRRLLGGQTLLRLRSADHATASGRRPWRQKDR